MSDKRLKITQIGSPIGRHPSQRQALIGLKLNRIGRSVELPATPSVEGQLRKLAHLLRVETLSK